MMLSRILGQESKGHELIDEVESKITKAKEFAKSLSVKPKVYIEEWDEPAICAIQWFSEVVELCGGENIYSDKALSPMAKDRFVSFEDVITKDPDIILACWCGKDVDISSIKSREGWENIKAVKNDRVIELDPSVFLQPGLAPLVDGIEILIDRFSRFL